MCFMKKTYITIITILILIVAGVLTYISKPQDIPKPVDTISEEQNIRYTINEEEVILVNGVSYTKVPGALSTTTTNYFGNEVSGDFDNDGRLDTAFLVTQKIDNSSDISYYLVARLDKTDGVIGTYGYFLGKNISPQSTNVNNGMLVVSYGLPNSTTVDSVSLKYNTQKYVFEKVIVAENPEGEANPAVMKLDMNSWTWIKTTYPSRADFIPNNAGKFVLTFEKNGFSSRTDCNGVGGEYVVNGKSIKFDKMMSTLMYCEGSQESEYGKMLTSATSYQFTSRGELILNLNDGGAMIFR